MSEKTSEIEWLNLWYKSNCNGDWEHKFGITISTIDNPGWSVEIDLEDTIYDLPDTEWKLFEVNDNEWYGYKIENGKYEASGDIFSLNLLILAFKNLIERNHLGSNHRFTK